MATYGRREGSERMTRAAASGAAAVSQASQSLINQRNRSTEMAAQAPVTAFQAASAYRDQESRESAQEFNEGVQTRREESDAAAADARTSMADRDLELRQRDQDLRGKEADLRGKEIDRRAAADEKAAELDEINTLIKAQQSGATVGDAPGGMPPAAPGGGGGGPQDPQKAAGAVAQGAAPPAEQGAGAQAQGDPNDPMAQANNLLQRILAGNQQEQMGKPLEITVGGRTVSIPPPQAKGPDIVSRANAASSLMNSMTSFRKSRDAAMVAEQTGNKERLAAEQESMRNAIGKTRDALNGVSGKYADPKVVAGLQDMAGQVQDPELQAFFQTNGEVGKGAATRFLRNQLMKQNLEYVATGGNFIDADYSHPLTADFLNLYQETAQSFAAIGGLNEQFRAENPTITNLHAKFGTFEQWAALDNFTEKNDFLRKQTASVMLARMTLMSKEEMGGAMGGGGDGRPTTTAGSGAAMTQQVMRDRRSQNERTRMAGPGPNSGPAEQLREGIGGPGFRQDWDKIR